MIENTAKRKMFSKIRKHSREGNLWRAIAERILGRFANDERIANAYQGDEAEIYVEKRLKQKSWHLEQSMIKSLLEDLPDGSTVLDVPFGTGRFVGMYRQKNMIVYGLDISKDMISASKQAIGPDYHRCNISIGKAECLPFKDDKFDLIICCRFLGLISYLLAARVLSELRRVSRSRVILYMLVRKDNCSFSYVIDRLLQIFGIAPWSFRIMGGNIGEDRFFRLLEETGFRLLDRQIIDESAGNSIAAFYVVNKDNTSLLANCGRIDG